MGEGRQAERSNPAATYATIIGAALLLFGLSGFFYNSSFSTADALVAEKAFGLFYVNGWQSLGLLIAGAAGLALAPIAPRLYCLASGLVWIVLAAGGFFGAHGGEAVPAMAGMIPAGTANSLLWLLLATMALAAAAAASRAADTGVKRLPKAKKAAKPKAKVELEPDGVELLPDEESSPTSIGRPRSATRGGGSRRAIN